MPTYEFECEYCDRHKDAILAVEDRHDAPFCCGHRMARIITAPRINPDIAPYKAVGGDMAGKYITSRKEHREFLKRNRLVEVGNEPVRPIKNDFRPKKGEIAQELKRVIPQVLRRG